ncbi:Rv1733c family protein [Actinophytocola sp. KF-1]
MISERAASSPVLRLARLLRSGRNPLARGVDRAEGAAVLLFVVLALVLVPVMLTLGSVTHSTLAERAGEQAATRHETVAILTEDAPVTSVGQGEGVGTTSKVAARWLLPDGSTRTGQVDAEAGVKAGTEVRIWLDESGAPVDAPMTPLDAVVAGVLVAVSGWLAVAGLFALVCWGLHHVLDRCRYRDWDTGWARVEPDWLDRHR